MMLWYPHVEFLWCIPLYMTWKSFFPFQYYCVLFLFVWLNFYFFFFFLALQVDSGVYLIFSLC